MFFIKPKEIVLDCFTANANAFTHAKPEQAFKFLPAWWKNISLPDTKAFRPPTNMKHCRGFIDYFRYGFALPLWSDLHVKVGPIGTQYYEWQYSDLISNIEPHDFTQMGNFLKPETHVHLKLVNPWFFRSSEDIYWSWSAFGWKDFAPTNVHVVPGVISYTHQTSTNINLIVSRTETEQLIQLDFRTPLVHLLPMSERRVKIKHHLITNEEVERMKAIGTAVAFTNSYTKKKNYLKEI